MISFEKVKKYFRNSFSNIVRRTKRKIPTDKDIEETLTKLKQLNKEPEQPSRCPVCGVEFYSQEEANFHANYSQHWGDYTPEGKKREEEANLAKDFQTLLNDDISIQLPEEAYTSHPSGIKMSSELEETAEDLTRMDAITAMNKELSVGLLLEDINQAVQPLHSFVSNIEVSTDDQLRANVVSDTDNVGLVSTAKVSTDDQREIDGISITSGTSIGIPQQSWATTSGRMHVEVYDETVRQNNLQRQHSGMPDLDTTRGVEITDEELQVAIASKEADARSEERRGILDISTQMSLGEAEKFREFWERNLGVQRPKTFREEEPKKCIENLFIKEYEESVYCY